MQRTIQSARLARLAGGTYSVDELPICQGLAQLHADVIAAAELYAEDARGNRIQNTPEVLVQPDPNEDRMVTQHKLVQSLWWEGNGYGLVHFDDRFGASVQIQNPDAVAYLPHPDPARDLEVAGWIVHGMQARRDEVNHWKLNDDPRRGPLGHSPLRRCWTALENYAWAYRYLATYFVSGGDPTMVLRSQVPLTATEAEAAQAQWVTARQSSAPAVLDPQWTLERGPGGVSDLEHVIRALDFAAVEVCRATNVAPSIANVVSQGSMTYSTVRDELRRWSILSLSPTWLRRIEDGYTRLIAPGLRARVDVETLFAGIDKLSDGPTASAPSEATLAAGRPQLKAVS